MCGLHPQRTQPPSILISYRKILVFLPLRSCTLRIKKSFWPSVGRWPLSSAEYGSTKKNSNLLGTYFDMKKILLFAFAAVCITSCSTWPKIYLGQSDGWLTYQSGARHLEVHWSRNTAIQGPMSDSLRTDSVLVIEKLK